MYAPLITVISHGAGFLLIGVVQLTSTIINTDSCMNKEYLAELPIGTYASAIFAPGLVGSVALCICVLLGPNTSAILESLCIKY